MYSFIPSSRVMSVQEFHVLLALYHDESHVYLLRDRINNHSQGRVKLAAGTLYPIVGRLHAEGLIDLVALKPVTENGKQLKHYLISEMGIVHLREELARLKHVVELAKNTGILDIDMPTDIAWLQAKIRVRSDQ